MTFLDDIDKKLTTWGQGAVKKTKDVSDTAKISGMIRNCERQKEEYFVKLGRNFYENHRETASEPEMILIQKIISLDDDIRQYMNQMTKLKGMICCPNCHAEIPVNSNFCNACGEKIEIQNNKPASFGTRKCSRCGSALEEGQAFCSECGMKVENIQEKSSQQMLEDMSAKICNKCGATIEEGQLFCVECGCKLENESALEIQGKGAFAERTEEADNESSVENTEGNEKILKDLEKLKCSKCGAAVEEGQLFCTECGEKITKENKVFVCPFCGYSMPVKRLFCVRCGRKID